MEKIVITVYMNCLVLNSAEQYQPYYQNQMPYDYTEVDYEDYESNECTCSCQRCEDIKPCCRNTCNNCFQPSSIVIVPYPYPLIISTKQKEATTAPPTQETTAPVPQETTLAPPPPTELPTTDILRNNEAYINDIIAKAPNLNKKNKFVLTNLRRTKPDWVPKYGIVPIPDNLAEKLMLQLRSMRVLHPKKETFKPSATLSSLEKII
ncbi:uncharacterized protein LOC125048743 [Pieris napi]|uniref:uncharacterized protein LOC125048743 n=1 Tax=Pieris napi TaxID=78633 RepID=UPI001FBB9BD3|nr:uncharacterized protein LOC125048743 [Pieris napi]